MNSRYWIVLAIVVLSILFIYIPCYAGKGHATDPLEVINESFPNAIKFYGKDTSAIEFCPDNTCDYFHSIHKVALADLKEFAYLYIYYFSDYYILDSWRKLEKSKRVVERILSKKKYETCKNNDLKEYAGCILINESRKKGIILSWVNYDEGKRNIITVNLEAKLISAMKKK